MSENENLKKAAESMTPEEHARRQAEYIKRRSKERQLLRPIMHGDDHQTVTAVRSALMKGNLVLPFVVMFALGSAAYVTYESMERRKNPVCHDCVRQKEIAEEVYGMKRPPKPNQVSRMLP